MLNPKDFGAVGDGLSHPLSQSFTTLVQAQQMYPHAASLDDELDWCAIQGALNEAKFAFMNTPQGCAVYIPAGRYVLNRQLCVNGVGLVGDITATRLRFSALGSGIPAVIVDRTPGWGSRHPIIKNINFTGPGQYALGEANAKCDGLQIVGHCAASIEYCWVTGFDKGLDYANDVGHIKLTNCWIEYNYYGIYISKCTGDYSILHSQVNHNSFANIATNASQGIEGLSMRDSHCGHAPFAIYCEPRPNESGGKNLFLMDVNLDHTRFEQIGNAAIYSDYAQGASPVVSTLRILQPGFSWDVDKASKFMLETYPRDYAIDVVRVEGGAGIEIIGDSYPFTKGDKGMLRVRKQVNVPITVRQRSTSYADIHVEYAQDASLHVGTAASHATWDGQLRATSFAGLQEMIPQAGKHIFSLSFANNPNKRGVYLIYADFYTPDAVAMVYSAGKDLYPIFVGGSASVASGETDHDGKLNVYVDQGNIVVKNRLGSDRRVMVVPFAFY